VDDPAITRDQRIDPEMAMIAVLSASLPSLSLSLSRCAAFAGNTAAIHQAALTNLARATGRINETR